MNELAVLHSGLPTNIEDLTRFALVGREKLAAVRAEIRAIDKLKLADEVRAQKLDEAQMISEAVLDAEVKIGALLKDIPKETTNHKKPDLEKDTAVPFLTQKQQARDEICISRKQADRFVKLAENKDIVEQAKAEARDNDDIVSRSFVLEKIKSEENRKKQKDREAEIQEQRERAIEIPTDKYSCIVIDPPWNYGTRYSPNGRRVANPYPEMTQDELKNLEILSDADSVVFLWTTQKFIWDAKELLDHWGFKYRAIITWDKEKMGMGDFLRMQCEFCLIGIKGNPILNNPHNIRDIIREPRREHSRKPEAFYEIVESVCAGNKIEYFSRNTRNGWEVYGNDTEKFNMAE